MFARVGNNAWKCITEQRYEEIQEHDTQVTLNAFLIAIGIVAVICLAVWLWDRD